MRQKALETPAGINMSQIKVGSGMETDLAEMGEEEAERILREQTEASKQLQEEDNSHLYRDFSYYEVNQYYSY